MVFTRKKKQQNKSLLSQLSEPDTDFMIGQIIHEAQKGNRNSTFGENITMKNTNIPTQIIDKVRCEVESVMTTIESKINDAVLTAIESLVIAKRELSMESVNACSGRGVASTP